MSDRPKYPKRLIEVDLPIKRISTHSRREKSIRHGHISTLHIWWARRPLASCRAVICATLWPDPADKDCPVSFIDIARKEMLTWTSHDHQRLLSEESRKRFEAARQQPSLFENNEQLRGALLDFIADFANWDNSTVSEFLATSRALTQAAHEALGGELGTRPLVVDPFAGGGSIPLEALRIGADAYASDLNPVAVLLNKVVLEYIPKYGQRLAEEVRKQGEWIKKEAAKELAEFYPVDADGATPIAYLWARTIHCEGPGCGIEVPLIRSLWLAKRSNHSVALRLEANPGNGQVEFQIINDAKQADLGQETVRRGSAQCPFCHYTTPVASVRRQLKQQKGGANTAKLFCVVTSQRHQSGRSYRAPNIHDLKAVQASSKRLLLQSKDSSNQLSLIPNEAISHEGTFRIIKMLIYGATTWGDLFSHRQALTLSTLIRIAQQSSRHFKLANEEFSRAVQTCIALAIDRQADYLSSLTVWSSSGEFIAHTFGRQAIPIVWEWPECQPFGDGSGNWDGAINWVALAIEAQSINPVSTAQVERATATSHTLPDDSADCLFTDPPYYHAIAYAALSDFFYVWLRRSLGSHFPELFASEEVQKKDEIIVDLPHEANVSQKDIAFYEAKLTRAFSEARRIVRPGGIGTIVFASKTTSSWEAIINAVIESGWVITGSWPIDTEREARVSAQGQARLASSVHLVCRPRENSDGSICSNAVGDWRDVFQELPIRIHEWMPRLAEEGVVGADAIFACLGPALEIFSRYSSVEKASGDVVRLNEYLGHVWAAVAKEALTMIFAGADATGFDEDARLTAMWLWTLKTGEMDSGESTAEEEGGDEEEGRAKRGKAGGFVLEYDAARKIGQGLGAHLENLSSLVEVSGETARLLPVAERAAHLFGKDEGKATPVRKKKKPQLGLFKELHVAEDTGPTFGETEISRVGDTVLDRIHQSMILFAGGRSEALRRFLVDDGAGTDQRFWRLAQALSALYPASTDEKRWVDGVLARKKGLGL
ncbi:MAG: DUF1156 domain-containing protein [Acidobacteria bacterium]|nr:DUF1156 domain-containing protein [Acidobacteriota bacterium]